MIERTARIHSIQTLGTLDGPGVRFVAFLQGCPLRCGCCHNPDTWDASCGSEMSVSALLERVLRCRGYFGSRGGVTLSGGEPLLQADFCRAFFAACREEGIHTCLDTSGCFLGKDAQGALDVTDRVLLDIKYSTDAAYRDYVGCSMDLPLQFLKELDARGIPTTLRSVIIPTLNDTEEHIHFLNALAKQYPCVDGIELLPFKKICESKYQSMSISFRFADLPTPTREQMEHLQSLCKS